MLTTRSEQPLFEAFRMLYKTELTTFWAKLNVCAFRSEVQILYSFYPMLKVKYFYNLGARHGLTESPCIRAARNKANPNR